MTIKINTENQLQWELYQLLLHIEYNPEYTAKQIKKDIADILADINGLKRHQVLNTVKEEVINFSEQV